MKGETELGEGLAPDGLKIVRLIGSGSMGNVYLARDSRLQRLVAIKILRPELAKDLISRQRFEREAQAAARISHGNVTQVFDVGRLQNDTPYIVMEYVEGKNLADVIASDGPMSIDEAKTLLQQLAAALSAAHSRRIIHRDVAPANVILETGTGRAVLTDFGLAGIQESGSEAVATLTRVGELIGDPRYMSPEQHRGEPLTEQSDVYSLGVVGYEMLTGCSPYGGDKPADESTRHLRRVPLTLNEVRPEVPVGLSELLKKCLAKQPEHRPEVNRLILALSGNNDQVGNSDLSAEDPGLLPGFFAQLKKRRVYQAAAKYLAAMLIGLEAADLIFPRLPLPQWIFTVLVVLALSGFPFVVVLAWIYDYRQGRLMRTEDDSPVHAGWATTIMQIVGLILSILLAAALAWWMLS